MNIHALQALRSTSRRCFSSTLKFSPNKVSTLPAFVGKSNQMGPIDMAKHKLEEWPREDIHGAIDKHSLFQWVGNKALKDTAPNIIRSEGVYLYGDDGKKYIDWSSGAVCVNLGHTVPDEVVSAITNQLKTCPFVYADMTTTDARARLCSLLSEVFPGDLNGFYFASGGAEANEAAIRMAKKYTGRSKIMTRYRSYHGSTALTTAATGDPRAWATDQTQTGIVKIMDPFPFSFEWDDHDEEKGALRCLQALHDQILFEGPQNIAAILLEFITGSNGWLKAHPIWTQGVRALCDKYGIVLIADEVMSGFGRCGTFFGFQQYDDVMPDMVTFAKGVSASYIPLSGVALSQPMYEHFYNNPSGVGNTYSAHPVAMAASYAAIKHTLEQDICGHVVKMESVMKEEMEKLVKNHISAKNARVIGLGAGIDLGDKHGNFLAPMHVSNPGMGILKKACFDNGLLTLYRGHVMHACPPLIIQPDEIREGFGILHKAFDKLDEYVMSQN